MDRRGRSPSMEEFAPAEPRAYSAFGAYVSAGVSAILVRYAVEAAGRRILECGLRLKAAPGSDAPRLGSVFATRVQPKGLDVFSALLDPLVALTAPVFQRPLRGIVRVQPSWSEDRVEICPAELAKSDEHVFGFSLPIVTADVDRSVSFAAFWLEKALDVVEIEIEQAAVLPLSLHHPDGVLEITPSADVADTRSLGSRTEVRSPHGVGRLQPLHSVASTEPRILLLGWHWALLAAAAQFSDDLGGIELKGFQLRDNRHWVVPSHGHPSEVYEYLARVCNVSCRFCYLYGNPDGLSIARGAKVATRAELDTRLHHYNPKTKQALFKAQWEINEFLVDPSLPHVLHKLRSLSQTPFFFVTNGNPLDKRTVDLLAEHAPVELIVSLNTADPILRQQLMGERPGQTARAGGALERLRARQIPFGVSIAAFPDVTRQDFDAVLAAAENADAAFVRVNLPGHTDQLPPDPPFNTDERWAEVVYWVQAARQRFNVPIISIPSAYEANFHQLPQLGADLWGVIKNSPAAIAGLRAGDVITRIGQFDICSRNELTNLALLLRTPLEVEGLRDGRTFSVILPDMPACYPHLRPVFGKYLFPHGLVAAPSLGPLDAAELGRILGEADAQRPVVVSSPLMIGAAQRLVADHLGAWRNRIRWVTAHNNYLGGNIRILDMATVGDLVRAFELDLDRWRDPDILVVPSSGFNSQGRDIVGRHWSDLGRRLNTKVAPLSCQQFLF
jgi:uncharacterized Fe-S cluster-containing radical SAM superfamily protein